MQDLRQDLEKNARFVSSQEEELTLQQQDIDALKQKIDGASEYDRLQLEAELSDEQESYRMLNETLVGQRRNVQDREDILRRHETVLARRQGLPLPGKMSGSVDLSPALSQVEQIQVQLMAEVNSLQQQVEELENSIAIQESDLQQQATEVQQQRQALAQQEQEVHEQKVAAAELWGKVNTSQEMLQLTQETLNGLRDKLTEVGDLADQAQTLSEQRAQSVTELQTAVNELTVRRLLSWPRPSFWLGARAMPTLPTPSRQHISALVLRRPHVQ